MLRQIIVPPGIGDNIWLLQKLINQPEKFNFMLPGGQPRRGKQIFDLLPQVSASCQYSSNRRIGYGIVAKENIQKRSSMWQNIKDRTFFLSANEWLEQGQRLENFLPDLETSYQVEWDSLSYADSVKASFDSYGDTSFIGIYGSSYSTTRAWNFWQEREWFELISMIHKINPKTTFCIIGAEWDLDLATPLISRLQQAGISYMNTVSQPLGYVIEIMKRLDYAFYFPSGLAILSETLVGRKDSVMFYPPHLQSMMTKWCDPKRTEGGNFKEVQFCTPEEIFSWVKDEYKLFDKL